MGCDLAGLDPERCEHALQVAEMLGLQADASLLELAGKRRFEVQKVMCRSVRRMCGQGLDRND